MAFYYTNGPWRCLWTKYGYDPRKHPEAKMYQTIDYRKRQGKNQQGYEGEVILLP